MNAVSCGGAVVLVLGVASAVRAADPTDLIFADGFDPVSLSSCPSVIETPVGLRERVERADVSYGIYQATRLDVDITEWDGNWGYNNTVEPVVSWPGVGGAAPVIRKFPRSGYIGAHFRTPADAASAQWSGTFFVPSYVAGPNLIMAISTRCGDFTQALPTPGCLADAAYGELPWTGVPTADKPLVGWKFTPNAPGSWCNLQPNQDYWVNLMFANPLDFFNCNAAESTCVLGTVSYHN